MSKILRVELKLNFPKNNVLQLEAKGTFQGQRTFDDVKDVQKGFSIFRHYPLSELEARSLHFQGSNPVSWIEQHVLDIVLLEGFQRGFDLRDIMVSPEFVASFSQHEFSDDGYSTRVHTYTWTHERANQELVLIEDGTDAVARFPTKGPQNFLQLSELQADVERFKTVPAETKAEA